MIIFSVWWPVAIGQPTAGSNIIIEWEKKGENSNLEPIGSEIWNICRRIIIDSTIARDDC